MSRFPAEYDHDWSETHFEVYNKDPSLMRFCTRTPGGKELVGVVVLVDTPCADIMDSRIERDDDQSDQSLLIRRIVACLRLHKGEPTEEIAKKVHHHGVLWA